MQRLFYIFSSFMLVFLFSCNSGTKEQVNNADSEKTVETKAAIADNSKNLNEVEVNASNETKIGEAFDYLSKLKINDYVFIKYRQSTTSVINKELGELEESNPLYRNEGPATGDVLLIETKVNSSDYYFVVFTWGPSGDPAFKFFKEGKSQPSFSIPALAVYITGNGSIYSEGHVNNTFNTRKKFTVRNDKLTEVEQPFYYVGLETQTLQPITLYNNENLSNKVASLPKNYSIEVVAHKKGTSLYLIKTDFGLIGWVKVESTFGNPTIKGLVFAGD